MKFILFAGGILVAHAIVAFSHDSTQRDQANWKTIPLKEIWALDMPGTRDVRDLEPDKFGPGLQNLSSGEKLEITGRSLISQIGTQLGYNKRGQSAGQAFAVMGTGARALREAAAVFSKEKKPQTSFPANSELSVVFFSHAFGCFVHLDKVEIEPGQIIISYRFVPHETKQLTSNFAVIPIGKLPLGEVKVDIKRLPLETAFRDAGFKELDSSWDSQVVAQSFRFT